MVHMHLFIFTILTSIIIVNGQSNCSRSDPCGRYGYCRDLTDGSLTCECKFWWDGPRCSVQTEGGKQVIALGCMLGFLMIVFYGLKIYHYIRLRRKYPKVVVKEDIAEDPKLVELALSNARRSVHLSSCITTILMLIVGAGALLAKWSLIQPIHNEIVRRYQTNQPIYYVKNSFCNTINYDKFNLITFPVSCFVILIFIIRTKRTSLLRDKCYGYGAPPIPVDFLSHIDRKFAAVVFAICVDELITIMQQAFGGGSTTGSGVIVVYLLRILQVVVMGFRYYPFLAAVYIDSILSLICATLYAWLDYSITIVNQGMCQSDFYPSYYDGMDNSTAIVRNLEYYGTGPNLIAIQLCTDLPRFLCVAYITVKLPMLLFKKIYHKRKRSLTPEQRMIMKLTREERILFRIVRQDSIEMLYVRSLFRSANNRLRSRVLWARLIPQKIYEWRDDFRFSARILCLYSSLLLLLYFITIQAIVRVLPYLQLAQDLAQTVIQTISALLYPTDDDVISNPSDVDSLNFPIPNLKRPYLFAVFITVIIMLLQLLIFLANVRRNLFQAFRGDDAEIPRRQRSRYVSNATGNFHFAGYFIGYLIWGFILVGVFSVIICAAIEAFTTYGNVRLIEKILKAIIPSILFVLFKQYLNKLLAQYVFLQYQGTVPSLDNRRLLMIFIYFNFFLDAFLGFISSIMRLIKSLFFGFIYMSRLDYSTLGRKWETMDGGFNAYCGFIHTECAHRHPVLVVFAAHLFTQLKMKQLTMNKNIFTCLNGGQVNSKVKSSSRYIRKWKLAVFLIRNPTIVFFRKAFLNQLHIEEVHALNDIDNNDTKNMQRRLSVYARRMTAARLSIVSNDRLDDIEKRRF